MRSWAFILVVVVSMGLFTPGVQAKAAGGSVSLFDRVVQVLLWSAIATDRHQSRQWVHTTRDDPATVSMAGVRPMSDSTSRLEFVCNCVYEENRWIAGQPQALDPYFDWWAQAVDSYGEGTPNPWVRAAALVTLADWIQAVAQNNKNTRAFDRVIGAREETWSEYLVIEYRIRF